MKPEGQHQPEGKIKYINCASAHVIPVTCLLHMCYIFRQRVGRDFLCRDGADAQYMQYLSKSQKCSDPIRMV